MIKRLYTGIFALLLSFLFLSSCTKEDFLADRSPIGAQSGQIVNSNRVPTLDTRKVLLLYLSGYNNLSDYMRVNIDTLLAHPLPGNSRKDDVVLVFEKLHSREDGYGPHISPVLYQLYQNATGETVRDTLKIFPAGTLASSARTLKETLEFTLNHFPAASYGLLFSSHATGWLPPGYYNNSFSEEEPLAVLDLLGVLSHDPLESIPLDYIPEPQDPNLPMVKSLGQEVMKRNDTTRSFEMTIQNFAKAIPMHLDYIIVDACLSGGIELAYELKDKTHYLLASQTEILADGIQYATLLERLFSSNTPNLKGICEDYYQCYANKELDIEQSATISLVDCSRLERLQRICTTLFEKYRIPILNLDGRVQRFFRQNKHWFFDLRDILKHAGITGEEMAELDAALAECIEYEAHTDYFLNTFRIETSCGLSMYLPAFGNDYLNQFYQTLLWNQATKLVK